MIEYKLAPNLRILFVGINPHPGSHRRHVPFSNNKTLWYLLNRAGLLNENEDDLRHDRSLRQMYDERFMPQYRLGFTNLVKRPTPRVTDLRKGEAKPGVQRALREIQTYRPKVACFIGKITYMVFRGTRDCSYGWQENIGDTQVYVMHFPIRGPASIRIAEFQELKEATRES